ncbi:MAG: hypothetical protein KAJ19_18260 [Gammaproteobacteria bacterium]|nr:hypothetical protein [Gammaproteobacteria bacterium]
MLKHRKILCGLLICSIAVVIAISTTFTVSARPVTQTGLRTLSYGPADMVPSDESLDYYSDGMTVVIEGGAGGGFLIPVRVPHGSYIKSIKLYADDQNSGDDICADLYRNQFAQFTDTHMGGVCTSGSSADQVVQTWGIGPQYISEHHAPYVWVNIPSSSQMAFYGLKILYLPPSP